MRAIAKAAMAIDELAYTINNVAGDDKRPVETWPDAEIMGEAKYVLDLFLNPDQGHINNEALRGDEGLEQKRWAQGQVRRLRTFIKKFD